MKNILAVFLLSLSAFAAGVRYDNVARDDRGRPSPSATIRICGAGTGGNPCPALSTIYSDHALSGVKSNPFTADLLGNYSFFAPAGEYLIQVSGVGITTYSMDWVPLAPIAGGGGGGGTPTRWLWFGSAGTASTTASAGCDLPSSAAAVPVSANGTNVTKGMMRFANSGTPALQCHVMLPPDLVSVSTDIYLIWTTATASGTTTWQIGAVCTAVDGSATDDPAYLNYFNPASATASGTPSTLNTTSSTSLSLPAGCAAGKMMHLRVKRIDTTGTSPNSDLVGFGILTH